MEIAQRLLNDVGELIRGGYDFRDPCFCDTVIKNYDVAFRPLSPDSVLENGNVGVQALGGPFEAVQLFLPDAEGRFPWNEGCHPDYVRMQTATLEAVGDLPTARAGLPRPQ